jgi:UrcA family protein
MFKITQSIAGAASLVLAALPIAALSSAAHAAPMAIKVADLNLSAEASQGVLSQRVEHAASSFCRNHMVTTGSRSNDRATCMAGVRAEAAEKVVASQPMSLAAR